MRTRSCWRRRRPSRSDTEAARQPAAAWRRTVAIVGASVALAPAGYAGGAPDWVRAQVVASLPAHDEDTNAVLLYSDTVLSVQKDGRMQRRDRRVYRILRPDDGTYGTLRVDYDAQSRVTDMHAWSIPTSGKDYEVKRRDAVDSALPGIEAGELMSDARSLLLRIPAVEPGSIVGYEYEQELRPYLLADTWGFQDDVPVHESHYSLQLPPGWSFRATWQNHAELAPASAGPGQWSWQLADVPPVRVEHDMPPWRGIVGSVYIALLPPDGRSQGPQTWRDIGNWYLGLAHDRRTATPEIRERVASLTAAAGPMAERMRALARFVQDDIRYVAIELGIGGYQPRAAAEVYAHRFGDCKDKATLLATMLKEIGVDAYYVVINTARGSISASTPPTLAFNHVILAVQLPADLQDPAMQAVLPHPRLGRLLFFDPTDTLTPFGRIRGELQSNYGLLVAPDGGELVGLPQEPVTASGLARSARLQLDAAGNLQGAVHEAWSGDAAALQRAAMQAAARNSERHRPVEAVAAGSLAMFSLQNVVAGNEHAIDRPFLWDYELRADRYARTTGPLMMVRPRVLGSESSGLLETRKPRQNAIEFEAPGRDTDVIEIDLPAGFEVDDLPPPVSVDEGFAAYQSRTEVKERVLRYTRSFEIRELSVPASKADRLKSLYRAIATDERAVAVLRRSGG